MTIFGETVRGCFAVFHVETQGGRGAQLKMPGAGVLPQNSYSDPLTVVGFNFMQRESYNITKCFNDRNYIYSFGYDPQASHIRVNFVGFLKGDASTPTIVVNTMNRVYNISRLSKSLRQANLSFGGTSSLKGFVTGMSSSTLDTAHNLQSFVVYLQMIKPADFQ